MACMHMQCKHGCMSYVTFPLFMEMFSFCMHMCINPHPIMIHKDSKLLIILQLIQKGIWTIFKEIVFLLPHNRVIGDFDNLILIRRSMFKLCILDLFWDIRIRMNYLITIKISIFANISSSVVKTLLLILAKILTFFNL